jgi:hypothetical protein
VWHLWLALDNHFLSITERRVLFTFKGMADALADLGSPVDDRILVLNILCGLNQCFEHVGSIIRRYSLFPNYLKVQDDLLLE